MILRKPYAFFIKMFKPIHFILALLVAYLIYLENRILNFLNAYIYSSTNSAVQNIKEQLASNLIYIIPIVIMILSLIILGVMFRKKKPVTFYVVNVFSFIVIIIINMYASNFLGMLEESIVSVKTVKLIHDLILLNMIIESIIFIFLVVRGMGINFKKFDFDSEISKFDISESDKEEFELDINVDLAESKRKRRRNFRYLKYAYIENRFLINCVSIIIICVLGLSIFGIVNMNKNKNKEGFVYAASTFSFGVDETIMLNTDYKGKKITDDYLIVVNTKVNSYMRDNYLFLKDFSLKIGDVKFKPTTDYNKLLIDLGNSYDGEELPLEFTNYLFVYEIPEKFTTSEMIFSYANGGSSIDIKLNPKKLLDNKEVESKKITEEIEFSKSLGDLKFKINEYDIKDKFMLEYNYCVKDNDCIVSREYIRPSLDKNYDKYILKLNLEYSDNSNLNLNTFYKFFDRFGEIQYKIGDNWYSQGSGFEDIKSKKASDKNIAYIGIRSDIINATSIKLVFSIRGLSYEYLLKGEL